jgi:regulator of sigma E protease
MSGIFVLVVFLAVLSVLVLVHEIGHFFTARKLGCKVDEFGIGFPPRLFAWKSKKSNIEYSVNWIPLGGFVRIKGESGSHKEHGDSFSNKPIWKRFVILIAGVAMNFLLAGLLLSVGFMVGLPTALDSELPNGAHVEDEALRIAYLMPEGPAEQAGVQIGDTVVSINGNTFTDENQAGDFIASNTDEAISIIVNRGEEYFTYELTAVYSEESEQDVVGAGLMTTGLVSFPVHKAVYYGFTVAAKYTVMIVVALYEIVRNLIFGQPIGMDLSGPVGIAVMTGQVARLGLVYLLQFTAVLSINLAVINVLPLPALDGGRILFLLIEAIRRKPINERIETIVHNSGFILLMGLIVLITYQDLLRFSDQIWGGIKSIIGI